MKRTVRVRLTISILLVWFATAGRAADRNYTDPRSCYSTALELVPAGETLLANPVWYEGACYLITGTSEGRHLHRVGTGAITNWHLPFDITKNSFAFVTAEGSLRVLTDNAIASCDLRRLGSAGAVKVSTNAKIKFNADETPAMGSNGIVYFKNLGTNDSIVAYGSTLQEIWHTDLKFTKVSPITVSANAQYAWVLGDVSVVEGNAVNLAALVRIDAADGHAVWKKIEYEDKNGDKVTPLFSELFQPAVASTANKDYVFVACNTSDTGLLQLMSFEPGTNRPVVLWTRLGKVSTPPALRVAEESRLFAFEDGTFSSYPWDSAKGSYRDSASTDAFSAGRRNVLYADGANSFYVLGVKQEIEEQQLAARLEPIIKKIQERDLELAKATETLAQQNLALAELKGQVWRGTSRVMWAVVIVGVTIGACLLVSGWILKSRKSTPGRA